MRHAILTDRLIASAFCLVTVMLVSACTTGEPMQIQLDRAVHFATPDGTDVVVGPGAYRVEQATGSQIRLLPTGDAPPILLSAQAMPQAMPSDPDVPGPSAIAVHLEPETYDLVLLLPGHQALAARGSVSGMQSRGLLDISPIAAQGVISVSGPDLVGAIGSVWCGNMCYPTQIYWYVSNVGSVVAGPSTASVDTVSISITALEPGKSTPVHYSFPFGAPVTSLPCLIVDVKNAVAETNENNNWVGGCKPILKPMHK